MGDPRCLWPGVSFDGLGVTAATAMITMCSCPDCVEALITEMKREAPKSILDNVDEIRRVCLERLERRR